MSITIELKPEIERQLRIIAEEEGITIELLVNRIIEDYIREYENSQKDWNYEYPSPLRNRF